MMKFTALVIALVLAPGLQASVLPPIINPTVPETRPLPVAPEITKPLPIPEVETVPELRPLPVPESPCDICFGYMSSLIEQLTEVAGPESTPEFVPEAPVLPGPPELLPQPVIPVNPELPPLFPEILPQPPLSEAEAEEKLAIQDRPLPEHIIR